MNAALRNLGTTKIPQCFPCSNYARENHALRTKFTQLKSYENKKLRIPLKTQDETIWRELCEQSIVGRKTVGKFYEVTYE